MTYQPYGVIYMDYLLDESSIIWLISKSRYLLKRKLQDELKEYDISLEQWAILSRVYRAEGCNQKKIAEMSLKDRAAVTRILNILENKELVERKNSTYDKREFLIYLTDKGHDLYNKTAVIMSQSLHEINSIFSESELEQLEISLNKLISNLE